MITGGGRLDNPTLLPIRGKAVGQTFLSAKSVAFSPADRNVCPTILPPGLTPYTTPMYRSLRQCVDDLESTGQLLRVDAAVDANLEAAEIQRRVFRPAARPCC